MDEFGHRLKYLRTKHTLALSELAEAVGSTKSALSRYENGKVEPGLQVLKKLSSYFGVTLDWLCGNGCLQEIEYKNKIDYSEVINRCIQTGITPEKLEKFIDLLNH